MIQQLFEDERFPNIVVSKRGTLLATWGSRHIRVRRSEDGGVHWGPEISIADSGIHGGGTTVDEQSGDILVFGEEDHPPSNILIWRSRDDGKSWSPQRAVIAPDSSGKNPSMHMNEHGITLLRGPHRGRLIRPARHYGVANRPEIHWPTHFTNAIYSDDGGATWKTSGPFSEFGTGEAALVELADGSIYYNSRRHWAPEGKDPRRRWTAHSLDGGATWSKAKYCPLLPDGPQHIDYGCMGGLTRLPIAGHDILLYSNCDDPEQRAHGTVWVSFDGGKTWPRKRLIDDRAFAYSSLVAGRHGTATSHFIYLHYESHGSKVARFNLAWLLAGENTGDGDIPKLDEPL